MSGIDRLQAALLALPEDLRVAIVLYDIEGQAYRDIAESLEIPEGTVKSRIHRARAALRQCPEGPARPERGAAPPARRAPRRRRTRWPSTAWLQNQSAA